VNLDGFHFEVAPPPILLIDLVEHLLEVLDTLLREVVDVGDATTGYQGDLQIPKPIERCRVGDGDGLENSWWVDRASRTGSHDVVSGCKQRLVLSSQVVFSD